MSCLVNGTKLSYKTSSSGSYTDLISIMEMPDLMANNVNKVDVTAVDDQNKQYDLGVKDSGDLTFKFRYRSATERAQFATMRTYESSNTDLYWKVTLPAGDTVEFTGNVSVGLLTAGGVDTPINFSLAIGLSSDYTFTQA